MLKAILNVSTLAIRGVQVFCLALLLAGAGCKQKVELPPPITIQELPAALEKAFTKADSAAKQAVSQVVGHLRAPDYSAAFGELQSLSARSGLTKQQRQVLASGLLTVNELLQQAQSQGDQSAAKTLQSYRVDK